MSKYGFPPKNHNNDFCTIESLLNNRSKFGLPHFQRGSVWNLDSMGKLLESLTLETPCGSIILWKPSDLQAKYSQYGTTVQQWSGNDTTTVEYLVIDGQQRLTNLARMFEQSDDGVVWALNMTRIRSLKEDFIKAGSHNVLTKGSLFYPVSKSDLKRYDSYEDTNNEERFGREENDIKNNKIWYERLRNRLKDLIPVISIIDNRISIHIDETTQRPCYFEGWNKERGELFCSEESKSEILKTIEKVKSIKQRLFQVVIKTEEEEIEDIIDLYNRINSSGVVVQEEERAYASFVKHQLPASWIENAFEVIKGKSVVDRDEAMKREREKVLGFKMIVRTLGQSLAYHMDQKRYDLSRVDMYFDWASNELKKNANKSQNPYACVYQSALRALERIGTVLRNTLHCDDFRFLHSGSAIRPVIALLMRYPKIKSDRVIAKCILSTQLVYQVEKQIVAPHPEHLSHSDLIDSVRKSKELSEALDYFPKINTENKALWLKALESSKTTSSIWSNLLYWMQRNQGVQDYIPNKENVFCSLSLEHSCQKEHVIPFSKLCKIYNIEAKLRNSTHEANSIGNLTYLSAKANFEHKDSMVPLWQARYSELLEAHQINRKSLIEYSKLYLALENDGTDILNEIQKSLKINILEIPKPEETTGIFKEFLRLRHAHLSDGFINWISSFDHDDIKDEDGTILHPEIFTPMNIIIQRQSEGNWTEKITSLYLRFYLLKKYQRDKTYIVQLINKSQRANHTLRITRFRPNEELQSYEIKIGNSILFKNFSPLAQWVLDVLGGLERKGFKSDVSFSLTFQQNTDAQVDDENSIYERHRFKDDTYDMEIFTLSNKPQFFLDYNNTVLFLEYILRHVEAS